MEGINLIFKNKEGKEKKVFFNKEEILDKIEDFAYEKLTEPDCSASTCGINGFCECDPINEDFEYSTMEIEL